MEHKPKTINISPDEKRHTICEACKLRKTNLSIYSNHLQKYDLLIYTSIYTQQNKLRKSQKTMQHKNTKANNYSIFI